MKLSRELKDRARITDCLYFRGRFFPEREWEVGHLGTEEEGPTTKIEEHEELMTFREELIELPKNNRHDSINP